MTTEAIADDSHFVRVYRQLRQFEETKCRLKDDLYLSDKEKTVHLEAIESVIEELTGTMDRYVNHLHAFPRHPQQHLDIVL